MPRSIWSGVVSFGVVSIPVKLYTATESRDIAFHLLHKECRSRLKQPRWSPTCQREEAGRGYEYAKGQHVCLDEADFERLPLPSKRIIQLSAFGAARNIHPPYHDCSYYLEPEGTGAKAFALLLRAALLDAWGVNSSFYGLKVLPIAEFL